MSYNMNEEEYKTYISSIINRLIKEKLVYSKLNKDINSNKTIVKIIFNKPEWYYELDDDTKYNVEYNLKQYYSLNINNHIQDLNDKLQENNVDTFKHVSKRLKLD